eukprot:1178094-Prorocentrum_minimum.AAC.2
MSAKYWCVSRYCMLHAACAWWTEEGRGRRGVSGGSAGTAYGGRCSPCTVHRMIRGDALASQL